MRLPGNRRVTLVKGYGTDAERREAVEASVQPKMGFFGVTTPIEVGDVIEEPGPRAGGGVIRRTVAKVEIYQSHGHMDHIEVTWGDSPKPAPSKVRVLSIGELHHLVVKAGGGLYADGHVAQAVFEAMKAVEVRIRGITGLDESGTKLIGQAFGGMGPKWKLSKRAGRLGEDEHEGRRLMLLGASQAVRNLGAHEIEGIDDASAIELLGLASQFMRWLDDLSEAPQS
jgi:uncharacterized protein (TIGR02391 family)